MLMYDARKNGKKNCSVQANARQAVVPGKTSTMYIVLFPSSNDLTSLHKRTTHSLRRMFTTQKHSYVQKVKAKRISTN